MPLPEVGFVLGGKYRIDRPIGAGGMGAVFEATHLRLNQRVAIKMLLPEAMSDPTIVARFEREARAAGQLRSTNTARVLDVDAQDGVPYIVMEFLEGHDLSQELEARGPLPITDAIDWVLQTCQAMREAHRAGIVHRDLKPSNLFLARADGRSVLKVLDFGISKVEEDTERAAQVTGTQTTMGTPFYMSPEQIRSAKHVDSRTDIWSIGIILYELLAGKTPFEGTTTAAIASICMDPLPSIRSVRPDVPVELEQVIARALEKERDKRIASVEELANALAPFARVTVISHANVDDDDDMWSLPTAAAAEHPFAPPVSGRSGASTGGQWTAPTVKPPRRSMVPLLAVGVVALGVIGAGAFYVTHRRAPEHPVAATITPPSATTTTPPVASTIATPTLQPAASAAPTASSPHAQPSAHPATTTTKPTRPRASASGGEIYSRD